MNTLNFIGYLVIIMLLFFLYNASEKGSFIFENNKQHNIEIHRDHFKPNKIIVDMGDEVTWISYDFVLRHTVVNDDPLLRNSEILTRGDKFKIIFDRPGDYIFYSSLYPEFEKGIINVRPIKAGNKRKNILSVVLNLHRIFLKAIKKLFDILFGNILKNVINYFL